MRLKTVAGPFLAVLLLGGTAVAQEDAARQGYAYVTYFGCDPAGEARADEIVKRTYAPHYDAAVAAGDIASWSWLAHFIGGKWRRALVLTTWNMEDLLDASGALGEIIEESTPEAGRAFTEVCQHHEDYIWQTVSGIGTNPIGAERAEAGFSMYFVCDPSREDRADEIVRESLAPIYDRHVGDGGLATWMWLRHDVGGEYRRLLSATAADHKTMMSTRAAIIAELQSGRAERATRQLNEICGTHHDYLWDVQIETP